MSLATIALIVLIALVIGATHTGSFRLDSVLNGSVYAAGGFPWSGLVMLAYKVNSGTADFGCSTGDGRSIGFAIVTFIGAGQGVLISVGFGGTCPR